MNDPDKPKPTAPSHRFVRDDNKQEEPKLDVGHYTLLGCLIIVILLFTFYC